jgi:hypothetical protein
MKLKREEFDILAKNQGGGGFPGGGGGGEMPPIVGVRTWPPTEGGEGEGGNSKPNTPDPETGDDKKQDGKSQTGQGSGQAKPQPGKPGKPGQGKPQPGEGGDDEKGKGDGKKGDEKRSGAGEGGDEEVLTVQTVEKVLKGKQVSGNTMGETLTPEQSAELQKALDIPVELPDAGETEKMKDKLIKKLGEAAKDMQPGKGKGYWIRAISQHLLPKVDWKKQLQKFIGKALSGYEDVLPSRRHVGRGEYITGEKPKYEAIQNAVMAVDTSGSMGDEELNVILTEIASIIRTKKVKNTEIVYFDDGLQGIDKVGNPPKFDLDKAGGGGGTSFLEPLQYMNDQFKKGKLELAIFCTDGFANLDLPKPKYVKQFVWVILDNPTFQAPWGEMVVYISVRDVKGN